jgi:molecular chaperone IbpA
MATLDFTPLYRSSIGFDWVPTLLSQSFEREEPAYPPYNIEKCGEDQYRIVLALAGFGPDDIGSVFEQNRLSVRGQKKDAEDTTYLHRGIAARPFLRQFDLADHVEVTGATIGEGLLVIEPKRELPEALKPRSIPIGSGVFVSMEASPAAAKRVEKGLLHNRRPPVASLPADDGPKPSI